MSLSLSSAAARGTFWQPLTADRGSPQELLLRERGATSNMAILNKIKRKAEVLKPKGLEFFIITYNRRRLGSFIVAHVINKYCNKYNQIEYMYNISVDRGYASFSKCRPVIRGQQILVKKA
jgi:hypothetical protein